MIRFEKVSFAEFLESIVKTDAYDHSKTVEYYKEIYDDIKLPRRATDGSAGYDFYAVDGLLVPKGEMRVIPTGIRFVTDRNDIVLMMYPRSGYGFKKGFKLANTVGIIDSDYWNSDNEGHIMIKAGGELDVELEKGKAFCQGIITEFIKTDDDEAVMKDRNGGFGSTTERS